MNRRGFFGLLSSSVLAPVLGKIKPPNATAPLINGDIQLYRSAPDMMGLPRYIRLVVTQASRSPSLEVSVVGSIDGDQWRTLEFDPPS